MFVCGGMYGGTHGAGTLGRDKRQGPPNSEVGHTLPFEAHLAQGFCSSPLTIPLPPNFPDLLFPPFSLGLPIRHWNNMGFQETKQVEKLNR